MLNNKLISPSITPLQIKQPVEEALKAMDDLEIHQLPVIEEDIYKGLIQEEDLLDVNGGQILQDLAHHFYPFSVKTEEYIINAVQLFLNHNLKIIPVVDDYKKYLGSIVPADLLLQYAKISGAADVGGLLVLEIDKINYSFGEISRLIETNDALLTQLNTYTDEATGRMTITIRINKIEISDVVATFQRYGYNVIYFLGKEEYENEIQHNFRNLINYLEI